MFPRTGDKNEDMMVFSGENSTSLVANSSLIQVFMLTFIVVYCRTERKLIRKGKELD
jgi:hypothetical protein